MKDKNTVIIIILIIISMLMIGLVIAVSGLLRESESLEDVSTVATDNTFEIKNAIKASLDTELYNTDGNVYAPEVIKEGNVLKMWYGGQGKDGHDRIHYAESTDGENWTKFGVAVDIDNSQHVNDPSVVKVGDTYYMYYTTATDKFIDKITLATSLDGKKWTKQGAVLKRSDAEWDKCYVGRPSVIYEEGIFKMWYDGTSQFENNTLEAQGCPGGDKVVRGIGYATSDDGYDWTPYNENPILADSGAVDVLNFGEKKLMLIEGSDAVYYSTSTDGISWTEKTKFYENDPIRVFVTPHMIYNNNLLYFYSGMVAPTNWGQFKIKYIKFPVTYAEEKVGTTFSQTGGEEESDSNIGDDVTDSRIGIARKFIRNSRAVDDNTYDEGTDYTVRSIITLGDGDILNQMKYKEKYDSSSVEFKGGNIVLDRGVEDVFRGEITPADITTDGKIVVKSLLERVGKNGFRPNDEFTIDLEFEVLSSDVKIVKSQSVILDTNILSSKSIEISLNGEDYTTSTGTNTSPTNTVTPTPTSTTSNTNTSYSSTTYNPYSNSQLPNTSIFEEAQIVRILIASILVIVGGLILFSIRKRILS